MIKRAAILLGLVALAGCVSIDAENGKLTEVNTFGSAETTVDLKRDGTIGKVTAKSDGTNVFHIFDGLFQAVKQFFGGSPAPQEININVPGVPVEPEPPAITPTTITA